MINNEDLKYFVEVAQQGHLTRASEKLGVTQPTVSHSLKKMEIQLKAKLFLRSKKGMQLTQAGKILLRSAQTLIQDWEMVNKAIFLNENSPQGLIRLGCHASVAQFTLPKFMPTFLNKYPEIQIQLTHGLSREMTSLVIDGQLDIGIVVNPIAHPDLIIHSICDDEVGLWKVKNCKNKDVLFIEPSLLQTADVLKKMRQRKFKFSRMITSSSLEVIAHMITSGAGYGIIPQRVLHALNNQDCEQVKNSPVFYDKICLVYKNEFRKNLRGRMFIESVKAEL